jgi:hypothetical protein
MRKIRRWNTHFNVKIFTLKNSELDTGGSCWDWKDHNLRTPRQTVRDHVPKITIVKWAESVAQPAKHLLYKAKPNSNQLHQKKKKKNLKWLLIYLQSHNNEIITVMKTHQILQKYNKSFWFIWIFFFFFFSAVLGFELRASLEALH